MSNPTTPGVLSPERLLAEARDEVLDAVMYLAAYYGALDVAGLSLPVTPVIDWLELDVGFANRAGLLPMLRERDAIGRARYGAQLMVVPARHPVTPVELQRAERLYRAAVEFAALFVEGA